MNGTMGPRPLHVPGRHVCQTCRRVLNYDDATREFIHPEERGVTWDHAPVPVPDLEFLQINEKCDFCFSDSTEWILPAADFVVAPGHGSDGSWAACNGCAQLIRANAWFKLVVRVKKQYPVVHQGNTMPPEIVERTHALFQELRQHITGPLVRIER